MLRKNATIVLIFLLQTVLVVAQSSRFKDDETIHVWASSGLNMRSKPDAKAEKIATIPYGAKVVVLPNIGVKIPFEVEEFKGFIVKGYWLLVKYENTEGFVFDGFLSRLPAPKAAYGKGLQEYLDEKIGKVGGKYDIEVWDEKSDSNRLVKPNEKYNEEHVNGYKQKYKFNIIIENGGGEIGSSINLGLPNLTLFEGYFLVKTFLYYPESDVFSFDKKEKTVEMSVKEEGAGCYYTIKKEGNKIVIDGYCGC
jgi:hypothetical protein